MISRCLFSLILLSGFFLSPAKTVAQRTEDDLRFDLPVGGLLRVENRYGSISAEVWSNSFVSVSADLADNSRAARSPIVIDNKGKTLSVSVFRSPVDPVRAVDIRVKLPASASVELTTSDGTISLRGLPKSAILKSTSGNIDSILSESADVKITAATRSGSITSTISAQPSADGHSLSAKLGAGLSSLEVQTQTGQITLTAEQGGSSARVGPNEPALVAPGSRSQASGTPQQTANNDELNEGDVIRVDSQLVMLNMSVVDRSTNRGFLGLKQSDFRLYENGEEQSIAQFDSASAPFDLFLLIDLSGSTRDVLKLIRAAATRFVDAARPSDRIGVVAFAGKPSVVSEPTLDRELLRQRIAAMDTARGDTKLYDATDFVMQFVANSTTKSRRTAIVLMSDGLDGTIPGVSGQTGSTKAYEELLKDIQEFNGVLYTLWLNTRYEALNEQDTQPEAFDEGHDRMARMAEEGGGIFYEVKRIEDLAGAYEQVVADLGTVYSLAYRPTNKARDGKWRAIRITITNRENLVARGKRGYYAN